MGGRKRGADAAVRVAGEPAGGVGSGRGMGLRPGRTVDDNACTLAGAGERSLAQSGLRRRPPAGEVTMPRKRTPGILERHRKRCRSRGGGRCDCSPSYLAWVWSPADGKKISETFPTEVAARGWRRDAASAVANGKLRASSPVTVEDEAIAWIERAERGEVRTRTGEPLKPATRRGYIADLRTYVIPSLGRVRLSQLQRRDVQDLVDKLVEAELSPSKVRSVLNALRAVLRRPLQRDELQVDPTTLLDLPAGIGVRDRVASPVEVTALLDPLPGDVEAIYAAAFYGGLRRGELRALRVKHIDFERNEIHVEHGWDDIEGEIAPKSQKGERRVPLVSELRRILLAHVARTGRRGQDLVFGRTGTEPFAPSHVRRRARGVWAAVAVGAFLRAEAVPVELDPIGLHECRHTFVSLMHAAGRSLEEIGDYVGHTSAYMTDRYRHLLDGQRQEAAAAFDALLATAATGTRTGTPGR